ncbi:MAG: hypothetical protein FWE71_15540 [Nocardioidaceae bacterium]|nr:hypothetical protein [Nocardioidaceae bacterium]MCL2611766.1 hypothetical protein [Nocardioidaceae bacterium]
MTLRVFQVATGNVGSDMIRRLQRQPDLDLVGVHCYSPDKVGRDAGELAGIGPLGVFATGTGGGSSKSWRVRTGTSGTSKYDARRAPLPAVERMPELVRQATWNQPVGSIDSVGRIDRTSPRQAPNACVEVTPPSIAISAPLT